MGDRNIEYKSKQIAEFYRCNRRKWNDFYLSERWVFEKIASETGTLGTVLDVGCACGGLGRALNSKFPLASYTGIDINKDAIDWASREMKLSIPAHFIAGDIADSELNEHFDIVVSLSCADWNIETDRIVRGCWQKVNKGGYLVISLRLTPAEGVNDIRKSYQYINFSGDEENPEIANYVVFNMKDVLALMSGLNPPPELIGSYGYWGKPSSTAVTPFDRLVFAVFYVRKGSGRERTRLVFDLPGEIIND